MFSGQPPPLIGVGKAWSLQLGSAWPRGREEEVVLCGENRVLWAERFGRYGYFLFGALFGGAVASRAVVFAFCGNTVECGMMMMLQADSPRSADVGGPLTLEICSKGS